MSISATSSSSNYSFDEPKQNRRFLVATISKQIRNGVVNIGPSEFNWQETPFVCGTDICRDFREYVSIDMHRLHALSLTATHRFLDFSFVMASCTPAEARFNFLCSNFYLDMCRTNFEKGLYEEVHSVDASDDDDDDELFNYDSEDNRPSEIAYLDDTELEKSKGYIVVAYADPSAAADEKPDDRIGNYARQRMNAHPDSDAPIEWHKWAGVRELCETLPAACTFRRMTFYREISGTSLYKHILLVEVNRILLHESVALNCVNDIRSQCDDVCIALYREVEFEIDLEALQTLVSMARSVKCVGPRLEVIFQETLDNRIRNEVQYNGNNDYDEQMEVLENSKKYSLGLLPNPNFVDGDDDEFYNKNNNNVEMEDGSALAATIYARNYWQMMKSIFVSKSSFDNNNNNSEDNGNREDEEVDHINNNRIQRIVNGHNRSSPSSKLESPLDTSHNKSVKKATRIWRLKNVLKRSVNISNSATEMRYFPTDSTIDDERRYGTFEMSSTVGKSKAFWRWKNFRKPTSEQAPNNRPITVSRGRLGREATDSLVICNQNYDDEEKIC